MSKFAYEPHERLYPSWMFVKCDTCDDETTLVSNPQKSCMTCRIRSRMKKRKWPDDYRGFGTNVMPRKQR